MTFRHCVAVDLGASSGRVMLATWDCSQRALSLREMHRFANCLKKQDGVETWDIDALEAEIRTGLNNVCNDGIRIDSIGIDTWGVDYVLLRGDEEVRPVYAYRDGRTEAVIPKVHEILPFSELYAKTGCQFQPFNSVYQLYADKLTGRLDGVTDFLMIPEYLLWKLCGVKSKEYTNATTTGMVKLTGLPLSRLAEAPSDKVNTGTRLVMSVSSVTCTFIVFA